MNLRSKKIKITQFILFVTANLFLVSCGTYQSVYNDDGIYGETTPKNVEKKIIVANEKEYQDYEENYFSKKLVDLQNIGNNEIFTDVDDYDYDDELNNGEFSNNNSSYNGLQPWGYEDNNVIVNVNLMNDPFWGGGFNNWGFNVFAVGGWNNWGWGFNNPWRWRRGFGRPWGFNTWRRTYANWGFIDPYTGIGAWNGGYLHPFLPNFGIPGFRNNRYYANNNFRYGRRNTSSVSIRNNNKNSSTDRRSNRTVRNTRGNTTRNNSNITRRNSSNIKKNNSRIRSNSTSNRNNSRTRSSSSNSRSSNTSSKVYRSSSRGSSTSGRTSSSRGGASSRGTSSRRNN